MDKASLKPVIESLIFASDSALTMNSIMGVLEGVEKTTVKAALLELISEYRTRGGGFFIEEVAGGYRFRTNPEFSPWIRRLFKSSAQKLSRPALETLAIVAYRQPATRADIEGIRGVDSGGVLATLLEKRLIRITGRKDSPGRPVVYGTTKEFLEAFDLKDLTHLPSLREIEIPKEEAPSGEGGSIGEASEDHSERRDYIEAQGGGPHTPGEGDRERKSGNSPGDEG